MSTILRDRTGSIKITRLTDLDQTDEIVGAASEAFKWSYAHGLKMTALASLAFAGTGLIACLLCENIDEKMNDKTEVYLENDIHAEKNVHH